MSKTKRVPLRVCVGCGQVKPKMELIRVVRSPEGKILLDTTSKKKMPGRGAYICLNEACFRTAIKKKAFQKSLKVSLHKDIGDLEEAFYNFYESARAS